MRIKHILPIAGLALGLGPVLNGATLETVRWDDLAKRIPQLCDCDYTVVAKSGEKHVGKSLVFNASDITIPDAKVSVTREFVAEIQIRHSRETYRAGEERRGLYEQSCDGKCGASIVWVAPLAVTQTAVSSVATGVGNALSRMRRTKVIRVAP